MKIEREDAMALKLAVRRLFESPEGKLLIEYLESGCGIRCMPSYDPHSTPSIILQAGRQENISILYNLDELTAEQIVQHHQERQL